MNPHAHLHCCLMGEDMLLIRCAELLLERGHTLHSMVTRTARLIHWAQARAIRILYPDSDLSTSAFDYLFSTADLNLIARDLLAMPRLGAIQFQNSPLSRYTGPQAPSWALLNGEKSHGVTWLRIAPGKGAVLKQRLFEIAEDDTAFTLNVRCEDAGVESFGELLDELASGRLIEHDPPAVRQTHPGNWERPAAAQIIRWDHPAEEIARLVRALDFGQYANPLGMPKLRVGGHVALVKRVEIAPDLSASRPGTVIGIDADGITLATTTHNLIIRALLNADGQALALRDFARLAQLSANSVIETLDPAKADELTAFHLAIIRHETFWLQRLECLSPTQAPYVDRKMPVESPSALELPTPLLHVVGGEVSAHDVLAAAFALYLARLGDNYHFDLGWRARDEMGDFANLYSPYVPLRVDLDAKQGGLAGLTEVLEALAQIKIRRTYARDMLARYPALHSLSGGVRYPVVVDYAASPADYVLPAGSVLALLLTRKGTYFVHQGIDVQRLSRGFQTFMDNLVKGLGEPLGLLPLLTAEELRRLFIEWNNTDVPVPSVCIHHLFEEQTARTPDRVAVVFEDSCLTYDQLNRRANQLARYLSGLGVSPDVPVGLYVERSVDMVVALLGILKAGGAYIPLDPTWPAEYTASMLRDSQASVLLIQAHLRDRLPQNVAHVVQIDDQWPVVAAQDDTNFVSAVRPENLSYIIYTSGSTSLPKGVQVEHRNVVNLFVGMNQHIRHDPPGVWLAVTSLASDISVLELLWPLIHGFKVVIYTAQDHRAAPHPLPADQPEKSHTFAAQVERHGVTHVQCTPALVETLIEHAANRAALAQIQQLLIGGEVFPPALARTLRSIGPGEILNLYGPTETTVWSSAHRLTDDRENVPIGRPIANTVMYVLDAQLQPVPVGVTGELFIGGRGVARGYLNCPELNAQHFVADPFSRKGAARLYRTGDLARFLPDGTLEFMGCSDQRVIIRGQRVELGEIEALLNEHPTVNKSAVIVREHPSGDKYLVAYVIAAEKAHICPSDLLMHLKMHLPEWMVPVQIIALDSFPLTVNARLDRKALAHSDTKNEP